MHKSLEASRRVEVAAHLLQQRVVGLSGFGGLNADDVCGGSERMRNR